MTKRKTSARRGEDKEDPTLFLEESPSETDVEKAQSPIDQDDAIVTAIRPSEPSMENTGCVFHNLKYRHIDDVNLAISIQTEIDHHTAEVKKAKGDSIPEASSDTAIASKTSSDRKTNQPAFQHHVLQKKASSVTSDIKHALTQRPEGNLGEGVTRKQKKVNKQIAHSIDRNIASAEALLRINPFKLDKKLDLLELREMLSTKQRAKNHEIPTLSTHEAQIQYEVFNNDRLVHPLFSAKFTDHATEAKTVHIESREVSGPIFRFRDRTHLLAVTRKNRKMQKETKFDVVTRIRETNRNTMNLAIRRRMINFLNESITKFDKDITVVETETEEIAKEFDIYLHQKDQSTISSIHRAISAKQKSTEAEQRFNTLKIENDALNCNNIRVQERITLINRFINIVYALIPEETRVNLLSSNQQKLNQDYIQIDLPGTSFGMGSDAAAYTAGKSETDDPHPSVHLEGVALGEPNQLPPFPFQSVADLVFAIRTYSEQCKESFMHIKNIKDHHQSVQQELAFSVKQADENIAQLENLLIEKEETANKRREFLHSTARCLKVAGDEVKVRELFRRPITDLEASLKAVVQKYVKDLTNRYPKVEDLLSLLRMKLRDYQRFFSRFPETYIRKWFKLVVHNREIETKLLKILHKHERRRQRARERQEQASGKIEPVLLKGSAPKSRSRVPRTKKKLQLRKELLILMAEQAEEGQGNERLPIAPEKTPALEELMQESEDVESHPESMLPNQSADLIVEEPVQNTADDLFESESFSITDTVIPPLPNTSSESLGNFFLSQSLIPDWNESRDNISGSDQVFYSTQLPLTHDPEDGRTAGREDEMSSVKESQSNDSVDSEAKKMRKDLMDDFFGALKADRLERGLVKSNESLPEVPLTPGGPSKNRNSIRESSEKLDKRRTSMSAKTKKNKAKAKHPADHTESNQEPTNVHEKHKKGEKAKRASQTESPEANATLEHEDPDSPQDNKLIREI